MTSGGKRDPGHRASAELPLYGVEGWPGQQRAGSSSGWTGRDADKAMLTSAAVNHTHADTSVTVTSHRQQDSGLAPLRRWVSRNAVLAALREHADDESGRPVAAGEAERLQSAAERDELPWQNVTIPVDGQPTPFQLSAVRDGWWVAAGRGPDADLTIDSRHVPVAGLALVRVTGLPAAALRQHPGRPRRPARQLPAEAGLSGDIPDHARIDLTFERHGLLTGSAGGKPVRLELNVPARHGAAAGTISGIPVSATWENGNNYFLHPDVPSDLQGSFAGQPVELHATFHLEPGYYFDQGSVTGQIGADALQATVESAGRAGTRTVVAEGALGSTEFTIYAAIDGPLTSGQLGGTVAGIPVRIDAVRTRAPDGTQTRLTGSYQGPPALLALAAGALLHFI